MYDTRDDRIAATRGAYLKIFQEVAGVALGGDANFWKGEVEAQVSRRLSDLVGPKVGGISLSLSLRSGLLWGLPGASVDDDEKRRSTTLFSDRFQLGGPTSVRSFKANGLGPRDGGGSHSCDLLRCSDNLLADSIGGELYCSAGASVIGDVPTKPHWPLKLHAWVNAGRLDGVDQCAYVDHCAPHHFSWSSVIC